MAAVSKTSLLAVISKFFVLNLESLLKPRILLQTSNNGYAESVFPKQDQC